MSSHFIYALTNCDILKWKKRLVVENMVFNKEKYVCIYKNYKFKILADDLTYPPTYTTEIYLYNSLIKRYVNNKFLSKSDVFTKKLYKLLNKKDIKEKYIVPYSIEYIANPLKKRAVKIKVLTNELPIID